MPTLPVEWQQHLCAGVSHRVGSCYRDGRPAICRGLATELQPDGRIMLLLGGRLGGHVLDAIRETGQVALVMGLPSNHRTLHVKGRDATVAPAGSGHEALLQARLDAFARQIEPFGYPREVLLAHWYVPADGGLMRVDFTIHGAWDQSPGPGAGNAVELT